MRKLTPEEIREGAEKVRAEREAAFKAHMERRRAEMNRPHDMPGRIVYRVNEEGLIEAQVHDDTGRLWKGTGKTLRHAYHAVIVQLEANAQKDPAVDRIFDVIDPAPRANPNRKPGPAQGNLL